MAISAKRVISPSSLRRWVLFEMFFGDLMFAFLTAAVDHRNPMGLRPAAD
jgi:hypothetical protein